MIPGMGNDLIDIRRVEHSLDRFGDRFVQRIFTEIEQAKSDKRRERAASYAKRFAAKEACAKALGTGVPRRGVGGRHERLQNGRISPPTPEWAGRAQVARTALLLLGNGCFGTPSTPHD